MHSLVLIGVVYFATRPVSTIPLCALAAVLMVTSFRMISATTIGRILRSTRSDALIFVLTAVITVCFDLIEAVEIGVVVAAVFALRSLARRSSVTREDLPGTRRPGDERIALLRLDGAMFFGVAERISNLITDARPPRGVGGHHPDVDAGNAGCHRSAHVGTYRRRAESRGVTVIIKGVQDEHLNLMTNVGVIDSLRHENHLIDSLDDAIAHARNHFGSRRSS